MILSALLRIALGLLVLSVFVCLFFFPPLQACFLLHADTERMLKQNKKCSFLAESCQCDQRSSDWETPHHVLPPNLQDQRNTSIWWITIRWITSLFFFLLEPRVPAPPNFQTSMKTWLWFIPSPDCRRTLPDSDRQVSWIRSAESLESDTYLG